MATKLTEEVKEARQRDIDAILLTEREQEYLLNSGKQMKAKVGESLTYLVDEYFKNKEKSKITFELRKSAEVRKETF